MRILEGGHYYLAKGPTEYSKWGWQHLEEMKSPSDKSMLFIDDMHTELEQNSPELELPVIDFCPNADFVINESDMRQWALDFLEILKVLPKKQRSRQSNGSQVWFCSGYRLTDDQGNPTCLLLDAGLTLYKRHLGFSEAVNILPEFYKDEQIKVLRLISKAMPSFTLTVILFNNEQATYRLAT